MAEDSEWREERFDRAFEEVRFMSPDYSVDKSEDQFNSRAYAYRSEKLQALLDAVDASKGARMDKRSGNDQGRGHAG